MCLEWKNKERRRCCWDLEEREGEYQNSTLIERENNKG